MQHEPLYLADIIVAADAIARLIAGFDDASFVADERTRAAVAFHLSTIGEAVRAVSDDIKGRHPHIAWSRARKMRNIAMLVAAVRSV
jgi:uncharacterized protein with HEPN domain